MYASSSRLKSNVVESRPPTAMTRSANAIARTAATLPVRMARSNTPMPKTVTLKSKFTERKSLTVTTTTNNNNMQRRGTTVNGSGSYMNATQRGIGDKRAPVVNSVAPIVPKRNWKRNVKESNKNESIIDTTRFNEVGVQTHEPEIINYDQLIGDIKFMLPSPMLVNEIDRNRAEARKKVLLKTQRKYEEHSEKQSEHLTDLKEFLERAVITKRTRRPREALELDRKLIRSMDELLNKQVPKTESITDIKSRIKKKEKELMTLFETVEKIQVFGNKNS